MKTWILSGPSGCGKTTWVRRFLRHNDAVIISADHYFYGLPGGVPNENWGEAMEGRVYEFDPRGLHQAHRACRFAFRDALMSRRFDNLVIDNTNISAAEKAVYYDHASDYGQVVIIRFETDLLDCIKRTQQGVPEQAIRRMWEAHHAVDPSGQLVETMPWWSYELA